MANQLQWHPVEAPRLDTRGLAIAGQTVNRAFDRFSDILHERDARLNKAATDAGAAELLAAQDPAALAAARAKAAAGGFGDRADLRDLAVIGNQRDAQLTSQQLDQSNLALNQNKQAVAESTTKFADQLRQAAVSASKGDHENVDAILKGIAAQGGGAAIPAFTDSLMDELRGYRDFMESRRLHDATIDNDGARTSMARTQFKQNQQDRQGLRSADALGNSAALNFRLLDQTSAEAGFHKSEAYKVLATQNERTQADQSFKAAYGQLTGKTGTTAQALAGTNAEAAAMQTGLKAATNRAKNAQLTPLAKDTRAAYVDQPDLTLDAAAKQLLPLIPGWTTRSGVPDIIRKIQGKVPGARLEDIVTAAKSVRAVPGFWNDLAYGDNGFTDDVTAYTSKIVGRRTKGYGQNDATDLSLAIAPFEAKSALLKQAQESLTRMERAKQAGDLNTPEERAAYASAKASMAKLLAGSQEKHRNGTTGSW